jgi:hypothetical protein
MIPEEAPISETLGHFFRRFHVGRLLKQAGITKQGGENPSRLLQFLLARVFTQRNFYRTLLRDDPETPKKDTVYRFLASPRYNWRRLLLMTAVAIAQWLGTLVSPDRDAVFIVDDSLFDRSRSKKVELLARVYDHVEHVYRQGFRLLMLGWSDGTTFLPAAFSLLSSAQATNRLPPADPRIDKRPVGYRRRRESWQLSPDVVWPLLGEAQAAGLKARYVLFDSWFAFPRLLRQIVQDRNLHVVAMVKAMTTIRYTYEGQRYTRKELYAHVKKRPGKARILALTAVQLETQDGSQSVQLVFVRDRRRGSKKWLALITTDTTLSADEVIRLYGKRWDIEVFFKSAKSVLNLVHEFHGRSYDHFVAHTTIVCLRYPLLAVAARDDADDRTIGPLFWAMCDERADLRFVDAWHLLMAALRAALSEELHLSDTEISRLLTVFWDRIPASLRRKLPISA